MMFLRLLLANLLVASVSASIEGYPPFCVACGCMECVGSEPSYVRDGVAYKKVVISSEKCAADTVRSMCCTGSRDLPGSGEADIPVKASRFSALVFPEDGYCKTLTTGQCEMERCDNVDNLEVEVPASAMSVRLQASLNVFLSADPKNEQKCGGAAGGVLSGFMTSSSSGGHMGCSPRGSRASGICDDWVDLSACTHDGEGVGDPHFQAWGGQWYDFHGACDLVFLSNPSFQDGLGMDVHIRTTLRDDFSYIESAALRIGSDVLEVSGWGEYVYNGVEGAEFPLSLSGYNVTYQQVDTKKFRFDVYYADGQGIRIQTVKDLVNVQMVNASMHDFKDSVGLLGHFGSNRLLSRDGKTNYFLTNDFDSFGMEWQVQADEAVLFEAAREPQAPTQCTMPTPKSAESRKTRRLGETDVTREAAARACAQHHADQHARKLCVSDVLALNDLEVADAGAF